MLRVSRPSGPWHSTPHVSDRGYWGWLLDLDRFGSRGGWLSGKVGEGYGEGYGLDSIGRYLEVLNL